MIHRPVYTTLCLLAAPWVGCASSPAPLAPPLRALQTSSQRVERSLSQARDEAEDLGDYRVQIRYNVPHCGAPRFEVLAYGRWTRVFLNGADETLVALEEGMRSDNDVLTTSSTFVLGSLRGSRQAQGGADYPIFEVDAIAPPVDPARALP